MEQSTAPNRGRLAAIARDALKERGLLPEFSPAVIDELHQIAQAAAAAPPQPGEGMRDLRELPWASIDNDDSRDLDQLSVSGNAASGATIIMVAVADVDALVKRGSAIDEHAATNTTSVYTAGGIFPMLPEQLSTDLTSLNEGVDRLAIVVEMTVNQDGTVQASDVYRALVRNHAKLAYNAVAAWLDGGAMPPHLQSLLAKFPALEEQLRTQDRVAQAMRKLRHEHGALRLQTPEAQAVFDGGELVDLQEEQPNRAKQLIEEFMVAANGVVAKFLAAKGFSSLRRVLRSPERWERIVQLAKVLGEKLPGEPDSRALDAFLVKQRDANPAAFPDLSLSVVKLLGRGEYAVEVPGQKAEGHFALAVNDYTHSTAPNRRFPDLITQRQLKAALAGVAPPYSDDELTGLAAHCTTEEANVSKVERLVAKSAAAQLLVPRIGQHFDGIVTGASDKGTWVRISHPAAEGRVVKGAKGLDVGDRVKVTLLGADVGRGFIDFGRDGVR
ncbi:MAG: rnb [Betaproteobacteria bacterium]|nr:rnb [Betaproteobacteria bacterium]